jgi:hypothetical protein
LTKANLCPVHPDCAESWLLSQVIFLLSFL